MDECRGVFYRYRKTAYRTKRGFASTETLTKLKRMSCPGCSSCKNTDDVIGEDMYNTGEFPIILPNNINDGDIIEPYWVPGGTDWETGYVDDWEIHARIVKDKV